jgi:hypothetical protein
LNSISDSASTVYQNGCLRQAPFPSRDARNCSTPALQAFVAASDISTALRLTAEPHQFLIVACIAEDIVADPIRLEKRSTGRRHHLELDQALGGGDGILGWTRRPREQALRLRTGGSPRAVEERANGRRVRSKRAANRTSQLGIVL